MPPTKHPCLITNATTSACSIWECHALDRDDKNLASKLKKLWALADDFDWNCAANSVWLRADYAESSLPEHNAWTFIPPIETISFIEGRLQILRRRRRNAPWDMVYPNSASHIYTLLPLSLSDTFITRLSPSTSTAKSKPVNHFPPYTTFPSLRHPTHPYFAIYNATTQLQTHLTRNIFVRGDEHHDELLRIYARLMLVLASWEELAKFPVLSEEEVEKEGLLEGLRLMRGLGWLTRRA